MKLTNEVVRCRRRRPGVAVDPLGRRFEAIVIVPHAFRQLTFTIPVNRVNRKERRESVPAEEEWVASIDATAYALETPDSAA